MKLSELDFKGSDHALVKVSGGELSVYLWRGTYTFHWYRNYREPSEMWRDLDPLTAQAVLFHLLPTE